MQATREKSVGIWLEARWRVQTWERDLALLHPHEMVGGPQHRQPLLVIAKLLGALSFRKVHHLLNAATATMQLTIGSITRDKSIWT